MDARCSLLPAAARCSLLSLSNAGRLRCFRSKKQEAAARRCGRDRREGGQVGGFLGCWSRRRVCTRG